MEIRLKLPKNLNGNRYNIHKLVSFTTSCIGFNSVNEGFSTEEFFGFWFNRRRVNEQIAKAAQKEKNKGKENKSSVTHGSDPMRTLPQNCLRVMELNIIRSSDRVKFS